MTSLYSLLVIQSPDAIGTWNHHRRFSPLLLTVFKPSHRADLKVGINILIIKKKLPYIVILDRRRLIENLIPVLKNFMLM